MTDLHSAVTAVVAAGSGVLAGVYGAFSAMVLPALSRRPAAEARSTMIAVNRRAERGPFILLFGGVAVCSVGLGVSALERGAASDGVVALVSLAGTAITVAANVPLNRRLERDGQAEWSDYARRWGRWNHLRAVTSTAALVIVLLRD